jgi:signal peptidase I
LRRLAIVGTTLIFAVLVLRVRFELCVAIGDSMLPTLHSGDLLLVDKWAYNKAEPRRGDIVSARYGGERIVKRIVGLPGETIELKQGSIQINNSTLPVFWKIRQGTLDLSKGEIKEGTLATMGDNQDIPSYAVAWPLVRRDQILGKVVWEWRFWE